MSTDLTKGILQEKIRTIRSRLTGAIESSSHNDVIGKLEQFQQEISSIERVLEDMTTEQENQEEGKLQVRSEGERKEFGKLTSFCLYFCLACHLWDKSCCN